jgi:hypothetical protein
MKDKKKLGYIRINKNGSYHLTISLGSNCGKRKRKYKTIYAETRQEAEKELIKFYEENITKKLTNEEIIKKRKEKNKYTDKALNLFCKHYCINKKCPYNCDVKAYYDLVVSLIDEDINLKGDTNEIK